MSPATSRADVLRRDLRAMTADGICFSTMVGLGEAYVPAFALALGHGAAAAGLLATLPLLAGACFQLVTPEAVRRLRSYRRWVVGCARWRTTKGGAPLTTGTRVRNRYSRVAPASRWRSATHSSAYCIELLASTRSYERSKHESSS